MSDKKKVLVLGGTGAMGVYVVPALVERGYKVDVVSFDDVKSDNPDLTYIKADAKNNDYLKELLKNNYDACIDFMLYYTEEFRSRYQMMLSSVGHYLFLSTYRIYADSAPITENSPRLLDVSTNQAYLATEDYSLYKAREEDIIHSSGYTNFTIFRPSIIYSKRRFQLVTLEANLNVERALRGKTVVIPEAARNVNGTMTWAGDVGKMMSRIVLNEKALGETYTIATSEHHTWGEIAEYYSEIIGMKVAYADTETYIRIITGHYNDDYSKYAQWQLDYDRLFNRVIDNSKILEVTGLKQSELMPLKEGLRRELSALPKDASWGGAGTAADLRMDEAAAKL